jgi:hypothetical protein
VIDANGQTVGEVSGFTSNGVEVVATVTGHLLLMIVSEDGILPGLPYSAPLLFQSNDCSGQVYLRREPGIQDYLVEIPDVGIGPPGTTAYVPDLLAETSLTMNSSYALDTLCTIGTGGPFVVRPATSVPLVDAPGARWTRPFRIVRR